MNCKPHTIFTHHSTTQTKSLIDVFFFYKGNWLRQMSTLVPGVIMNCKLHTIFTHPSTTQTKSLIDVFFSLTKMTGSDRRALLSQEWSWTVSHIRYLHTFQLHRLNHWLMFFFLFYKGDWLGQMCTLVPGVIINCKPHTIFTHLSTTQWLNHWLMFFSFTKVTGSDRCALLSQEWSWTVSYIRYLHTIQLPRLNHWLMFFFFLQRWPVRTDEHSRPRSDCEL